VYVEPPPPHRRLLALTFDPAPLALGRLSGNVEALFAPHHAIIVSPNILVFQADRGGPTAFASEGFGFATRASSSFGVELGYHYYGQGRDALRGLFLGPSLLLGTTSASTVDPSRSLGYWGLAFDVGDEEVLRGGFTLGGGVGLGVLRMSNTNAAFPRILLQIGWSL
jgi:hypothetical protein